MNQDESEKATAELPILRNFIDFVNQQVGVYSDCLSGFQGNKVRIERQKARVQRASRTGVENGRPVIVCTSVEDPSSPDVIHHRIIRADDFIAVNAEAGFNEQQTCRAIIVFLFAHWDEEIRPRIAEVRGVKSDDVKLDELGDLRILRKNIVHNGGLLPASEYAKLKVMKNLVKPDAPITFSHDQMHKVFVHVKQAIGTLILKYTGGLPGAPIASELAGIAIQNV
jgi:hypothetical protein